MASVEQLELTWTLALELRYDWLLQFQDGQPAMGWHDYLCYLAPEQHRPD